MQDNFKLHDRIVKKLLVNNFDFNIIDIISKEEYFFICKDVDINLLHLMKRRMKAMEMVDGYAETILKLTTYFQFQNDSIFLGEFIVSNNSFYVFFDCISETIISIYNSPHLYKDKIIQLNSKYAVINMPLIKYEIKDPFDLLMFDKYL